MINFKRGIFFWTLFFVVSGVFVPLCYQPDLAAWETSSVTARNFAPGQLDVHYLKHGDQFGGITKDQYLQQARQLLDAPAGKDVLEKIRPNGDIEHFRVSTGEFAVMTKRGRIRTYFKVGYVYWIYH